VSVTSGAFSLRRFGRSQPWRALPPGLAVFRRAFMDARIRTISFACVFAIVA
jgi:hypothetical protein